MTGNQSTHTHREIAENIDGDAFAPFQQGRFQDDGLTDLMASFESRIQ